MVLTVRLAANALVRQYVIHTQLSVSVNPGTKEQLADRVSKQKARLPAALKENEPALSPPPPPPSPNSIEMGEDPRKLHPTEPWKSNLVI